MNNHRLTQFEKFRLNRIFLIVNVIQEKQFCEIKILGHRCRSRVKLL
jgi:hypothetical protein